MGAPKGNSNALKTGERSEILKRSMNLDPDVYKAMSTDERANFVAERKKLMMQGLRDRMVNPVVSISLDLEELEMRLAEFELSGLHMVRDPRTGEFVPNPLNKAYLDVLKTKQEYLKVMKQMLRKEDKTITHVIKRDGGFLMDADSIITVGSDEEESAEEE